MGYEQLLDLTRSAADFEEVKTNLMLAGISYTIKPAGGDEKLEVEFKGSKYRVQKDGRLIKTR